MGVGREVRDVRENKLPPKGLSSGMFNVRARERFSWSFFSPFMSPFPHTDCLSWVPDGDIVELPCVSTVAG